MHRQSDCDGRCGDDGTEYFTVRVRQAQSSTDRHPRHVTGSVIARSLLNSDSMSQNVSITSMTARHGNKPSLSVTSLGHVYTAYKSILATAWFQLTRSHLFSDLDIELASMYIFVPRREHCVICSTGLIEFKLHVCWPIPAV